MSDRRTPGRLAPTATDPSVAVVIMSYNRPDTILETIDSLLAQARPLTSIAGVYLADDCSTDTTVRVSQERWRSTVPLTLWQPKKNSGTWGNVNHALATLAVRHDWVLLLHDDDLVKPNWLGAMCDQIRACPPTTLSICSSWDSLNPDGATVAGEDDPSRPIERVAPGDPSVRSTLLRGCWWHFSGCAIRTEGFLDVGAYDPRYPQCADQDWLMRGLERGWSIDYIPRTLLVYRQHHASLSSRSFLVHQDLVEQLMLADRYGRLLSRRESARFHARLVEFAARRAVRALGLGRWAVLRNAVKLIPRCIGSWVRSLGAPAPARLGLSTQHSAPGTRHLS
jgi:GT2 family glycosyltransferase